MHEYAYDRSHATLLEQHCILMYIQLFVCVLHFVNQSQIHSTKYNVHKHNTHTRRVRDLPNAEEGVRKERHVKMQRDRDTYAHSTHTHKPEGGRGHAKEGIHREREEERDRDTYTQTAHTHLKGAGYCPHAEEGF